jgi:hypothetical protein
MRIILLLLMGVVAAYMLGPHLPTHVLPFLGNFSGYAMRLDPSLSNAVDDRRGQHRASFPGGPEGEDSDYGRGSSGFPGGRGGTGMESGEEGHDGFPGGMGGPGRGGSGGGLRCRDTRTGRDVPLSYCEWEHGGRHR